MALLGIYQFYEFIDNDDYHKQIKHICRPGGTEASCFSPQFGGSCFGTVNGCKDCNQVIINLIPADFCKFHFFTTFKIF